MAVMITVAVLCAERASLVSMRFSAASLLDVACDCPAAALRGVRDPASALRQASSTRRGWYIRAAARAFLQ
jgi:hypothetical protein